MERRRFLALVGMIVLAAVDAHAQGGPPAGRPGPGGPPPASGGPPPASGGPPAGRAAKGPRWGAQAEKELMLGPGMGPKLMTEQEWQQHRERMRTLAPEEREAYRRETHARMLERAREKGIEIPPAPRRAPAKP